MQLPAPEGCDGGAAALAIVADAGTGRYLLLRVKTSGGKDLSELCWRLKEAADPRIGDLGHPQVWLSLGDETGEFEVKPCEAGRDGKFADNPALSVIMLLTLSHIDRFPGAYAYSQMVREDPSCPGGKVIFQMFGFQSDPLGSRVRARVGIGRLMKGTGIQADQTVQEGWLDVLPLSRFVDDPLR